MNRARVVAMVAVGLLGCSSPGPSEQPAHVAAPATTPPAATVPARCIVMPQPSKPGHTTVEPDDMACTHGDTFYDCPTGVDLSPQHCAHPTHKGWWSQATAWCCPG